MVEIGAPVASVDLVTIFKNTVLGCFGTMSAEIESPAANANFVTKHSNQQQDEGPDPQIKTNEGPYPKITKLKVQIL